MLDRDGRVLRVGDQLPRASGVAAEPVEDQHVIGTGTDHPGGRSLDKLR